MPDFSDPNFDFDEAQKALDRKRKIIAATLAQPAAESGYSGKYYVPPYEQLMKAITGAAGAYDMSGLDKQGAELSGAKNAAIAKLLAEQPQDTPAQPGQPEVIGTGPVAPPPGTPGVEQAPPPPPAGEADATAMPPVNNMMPKTPAVWEGYDKGLTPAPEGEFLPNKAAVAPTPMVPRTLEDMTKWAGKFSRFGDVGDITKEAIKFGIQQPERAQLAREAAAARALVEQHRYEDKLADNKRDQQRVDEILRSNRTTQEEKARANRESERLREEGNQIRRDALAATAAAKSAAALEKQTDHEKTVIKHTKEYGLQLEKEKVPQYDTLLSAVEKNLEGYKNPDGSYQSVPGLGVGGPLVPDAMLDDKALNMRRALVSLRRLITTSEAGLSQTKSEMEGVLDQLGVKTWSPIESLIKAVPNLRTVLESRKNTIASSFEPEAVSTFHKRAKTANPLGDAPVQVRSKADYDKLPSGTVFIPEDGSAPRTKP
jgi:hypothetical protein